MKPEIRCPSCQGDAFYRYGKTHSGKQRLLCLVCNRQFTLDPSRQAVVIDRPFCPACGAPMHVYMHESGRTRFRCSKYPRCRTFVKRETQER